MSDDQTAASSVARGKRKERDDHGAESIQHGSTLFVSNLPYTATSTDLQTLFSDFAPVRSAFVVVRDGASKGVGYVSFAIKEDAIRAMEELTEEGLTLDGRELRIQWPDKKPKDEGTSETKPRTKPIKKELIPSSSKGPTDPNAIRTIVISGLPSSIDQKVLWKKVRKFDGAEKVDLIDGETGVAHAVFSTAAAANHAVEKLHAHVFKGSLLSVTLKKRLDSLVKAGTTSKSASKAGPLPAPSRASRLIVRNLPWDISENDLRALFLPYGPIHSIDIPTTPAEDKKMSRGRGFAFVWFFSKKDAEKAIEGANARTVSAGAIVAPTMNKKERARLRKKLREDNAKVKEENNEGGEDEEHEDEEGKEGEAASGSSKTPSGRVIAVDWALSKDKWEEAKAHLAEDGDGAADGSGDSESGTSSSAEDEDESDDDSSAPGDDPEHSDDEEDEEMDIDGGQGEEDSDDSEAGDDESSKPGKPTLPPPEAGTTLFVRNVPFEATEDELRVLFRAFGPLRYARITMDQEMGRSRGTGFVCFWKKEDADKAFRQSELVNEQTAFDGPKKNPFSFSSILTPDPSSSLAQSLVLHGRTLDVQRAVTRDEASKLKEDGERQRQKADKRNLYLLREGVIFPNTPAASTLPPVEVEKRATSFSQRRTLLKSNPSLYISKTRLSVRQLPLYVTERGLKRLALHAIRSFQKEVKAGERDALTADELFEPVPEANADVKEEDDADSSEDEDDGANISVSKAESKRKKRFKGRPTAVRQAKIVRQSEKVDAVTGKGKSKGYGFLELDKHADALRVLRWVNNNAAVGALLNDWWKAELQDLILKAGGKETSGKYDKGDEDTVTRLKRLKEELERVESGSGRKAKGSLIVEFSIENVQVVIRRKALQKDRAEASHNPETSPSRSKRSIKMEDDEALPRPTKRLRREGRPKEPKAGKGADKSSSSEDRKLGQKLGSVIGRKRKQRHQKTRG